MKKSRSGFTLIEAAISIAVLGVVSTTVVEVIQWSAAQHRQAERKRCAVGGRDNHPRRIHAPRLVGHDSGKCRQDALARRNHSGFRGSADVPACERGKRGGHKESGGRKGLRGKCISVEISWANRASPQNDRVHLATWVFAHRKWGKSREGRRLMTRRRAFTLIELLVAMSLFAVILPLSGWLIYLLLHAQNGQRQFNCRRTDAITICPHVSRRRPCGAKGGGL